MKKDKYKEAHVRSVIKAVSWRVFATATTILVVFAFTRKLVLSLGVGAVEAASKLILYYLHERTWTYIPFGKKKHPLSSLPVEDYIKKEDMQIIRNKLKELGYLD